MRKGGAKGYEGGMGMKLSEGILGALEGKL